MITVTIDLNNYHGSKKNKQIGSMHIERIPNAYRVTAHYWSKDDEMHTTSFIVDKPEHNRTGQSAFNLVRVMLEKLMQYDERFAMLYTSASNNPPY